jgi:PhnB protein
MQSRLIPYLNFRDETRQAMLFYQTVFGGRLSMTTFAEFNASDDPAEADKIMHSMLEADNGIILMAADVPNRMEYQPGASVQLSLNGDNEPELRRYFQRLSEAGQVSAALKKAPWGDIFGMCQDRFGINWMVNISKTGL